VAPVKQGDSLFLSRSKIETIQACPRKGYYEYAYAGRGISVDPGAIYFDSGNAVHAGLAQALTHIRQGVSSPNQEHVKSCIGATISDFDKRSATVNVDRLLPHVANLEMDYRVEQRNLCAAIVYAWILHEWEAFANRYEVLAVELDTHFQSHIGNLTINWESKADAIVRERKAPYQTAVISWKTAQDTKEWTRRRYRSDLQGNLETYFAELHTGIAIDYNQVIYLVKGKKLRLAEDGSELPWDVDLSRIARYTNDTFLLGPLAKPSSSPAPFFNEISDILPNVIWKSGYIKPGNVSESYIRGYQRKSLSIYDLDANQWPFLFLWIEALNSNQVFPTNDFLGPVTRGPLSTVVVWEQPSARNRELTEQLLEEITYLGRNFNNASLPPTARFFRNLRTCYDGPPNSEGKAGCPYNQLCKGPTPTQFDLHWINEQPPPGFIWRIPHHIQEHAIFSTSAAI
jgi:hypothetical protein